VLAPNLPDAWPDGDTPLAADQPGDSSALATTNNLDISQAREIVTRSQLNLERARLQFVPTMNLGSTYIDHEGTFQKNRRQYHLCQSGFPVHGWRAIADTGFSRCPVCSAGG